MTDIGPTGYVSDGQIIAWLEAKSLDQYSGLNDLMSSSDKRTELANQLTQARAAVDGHDPDAAFATLGDALSNCEGPDDQKYIIGQQLGLIGWTTDGTNQVDTLDAEIDASSLTDADKKDLHAQVQNKRDYLAANDVNADTPDNNNQHKLIMDQATESLQGKASDLSNLDSLELIKIQQAVANAKQTQELASNTMSSNDQAGMAIIGNYRG